MTGGQIFTAPTAAFLAEHYRHADRQVFYDHGGDDAQRLYAWFGAAYVQPNPAQHLAWVDIVVADPTSRTVYQIVEIEDSSARPKTILADLMAVLLGDGLAFGGHVDWQIGAWMTFFVCVYAKAGTAPTRLAYLHQQVTQLQPCLQTRNAAIGRIVLATFQNQTELIQQLAS